MSLNKGFFEQLLFVFGSMLTCAFILASSRMDLQIFDSSHLETRLATLSQNFVDSAEFIRDQTLLQAAGHLPGKWVTFLNSTYLADLRDEVTSHAQEPLVGALPIQTAACSTEELRHILQGEMTPIAPASTLTTHQTLMDETRPTIEQMRWTEHEMRLDHFRLHAILDSIYDLPAHVQILASQLAPEGLQAIVVVEHKCKPVDDPSTLLPNDPTQDMTVDPASQEATLDSFLNGFERADKRNDAPTSSFQNVAFMTSHD